MSVGLSKSSIQSIIDSGLHGINLDRSDVRRISEAVAEAISKNNKKIEEQLNAIRNSIPQ